jgi:flagellar biosynthesis regulator FlaF
MLETETAMTIASDDVSTLSLPQQEAFGLTEAAIQLDQARNSAERSMDLAAALDYNLEIWVAIRALAQSENSALPQPIRDNLMKLSDFVAQTTFSGGPAIADKSLDTLININLQLAEGLLEGQKAVPAV